MLELDCILKLICLVQGICLGFINCCSLVLVKDVLSGQHWAQGF